MKIHTSMHNVLFLLTLSMIALPSENHSNNNKEVDINIGFLFLDKDNFYRSIPNHGIEVFNMIINDINLHDLTKKHHYKPAPIPKGINNKTIKLLNNANSNLLSAVIPEYSDSSINFSKSGFVLRPSGDGGYWGFLGKLQLEASENHKEILKKLNNHIYQSRPVGICWTKLSDRSIIKNNISTKKIFIGETKELLDKLPSTIDHVKYIIEFSLDKKSKIYIIETKREDGASYLFSFVSRENKLIKIPFEIIDSHIYSFMQIEPDDFANDLSLHDTQYWLINIEELKSPILFIQSTVSYIFQLQNLEDSPSWEAHATYYRGP